MIVTPVLIIFLVVVFVLLYLFLNTVDKRKWLTVLISLMLTPFAFFYVAYPFVNIISNYHHQKYFSAKAWNENPKLRYEMIDHAIASDTLLGKSKPEIETLLGKAEWLSWNKILKEYDPNKWNYSLGIEPGAFTNEKDQLEVVFINDKVSALNIYTEPITFENAEE